MENLDDSGKDLKKNPEHAIGQEMRRELRLLITTLLKAAKDIQFYPRNSPVIEESIERVVETVRKVSGSANTLVFEVRQHQFLVHNTPLIDEKGPERDFAEQLFGLGVRVMEIEGVPTPEEFKSFITTTRDAHRVGAEFGKLSAELKEKGVSSIHLLPSGSLNAKELVDVSGQSDAGERGLWIDKKGVEGCLDRITRLLDEYCECLYSHRAGAQRALDYIKETDCLAVVSEELDGRMDDQKAEPVRDRFFQMLAETFETAHSKRPSVRQGLLAEVSRCVEGMDATTRTSFIHSHFMGKSGPSPSATAILHRLDDDILSDLLAESLVVHGGAESAIQTYFMTVPVPAERQADIAKRACKKAKHKRADDSTIERILAPKPEKTGTETDEKPVAPTSHTTETFEAIDPSVVDILEMSVENQNKIQESARTELNASVKHNAATMMALLGNTADSEHLANVLNALEMLRRHLLGSPDGLVQATEIVDALLKKRQASREVQPTGEIAKMLETAVNKTVSNQSIQALLDLAVQCAGSDRNYDTILRYIRMVGEPGYKALADSIRKEDLRSRRMAARRLVVSLGEVCVDLVAHDIGREEWFVVRNVVSILGDIRSDEGIGYLDRALIHADERVRREAVNALGKIGTKQAARTLANALNPDDMDTAHAAVRWLGLMESKQSVAGLMHLMDNLGNSPKYRQVKLSVVDSLTQIGSPMALARLKRVRDERILFFFKKDAVLSAAAARAIETIVARVNDTETRRTYEDK